MTNQNNKISCLSLSLYLHPSEPTSLIEVIEGEQSKNWVSKLPFCGILEDESLDIEKEETKRITRELANSKLPLQNNNPKIKLRMQKCLRKNKKLNAKITNTLCWIDKEASEIKSNTTDKRKINLSMQLYTIPDHIESLCKVGDTTSSSARLSFSQGESYVMKPNIVTIQEAIVSCASTFDIHVQDPEYFIDCLEEYKAVTRKYLRKPSEYEVAFRRFRRNIMLHRCHQKQNETSINKCYRYSNNDWWNKTSDYFLYLTSETNSALQELFSFTTSHHDFPFLNMFAVNRLSALLRALKYCRDKDINFDNFKELINGNQQPYLRSLGKNSYRGYFTIYPNKNEFYYLLSLKREDIPNEINILCSMLSGRGGDLFVSEEEKALEDMIERQKGKNLELGKRMMKRMKAKKVLTREAEKRSLINSYEKYMSTINKKEEILSDNRCSTEYTDKKITVLQ